MSSLGSMVIDLIAETAQFRREMSNAASHLGRTANDMVNSSRRTTSAIREVGLAAAGTAVTYLSINSAANQVQGLISANTQYEKLKASLETVEGSAAKAQASMGRLQEFAKTTPYELDQTTQAYIKLKTLGLDASDRAMKSYGNTASAFSKDIMQYIEAVADASTMEFERLKEFGIRVKQETNSLQVTFQGHTQTIGKNAKDITDFLTKIGETTFAGAMERQMAGLPGKLSNLQDSVTKLKTSIGEGGFNKAVGDAAERMGDFVQSMVDSGQAARFGETLGETIKSLTQAGEGLAKTYGPGLAEKINQVSQSIRDLVQNKEAIDGFIATAKGLGILFDYGVKKPVSAVGKVAGWVGANTGFAADIFDIPKNPYPTNWNDPKFLAEQKRIEEQRQRLSEAWANFNRETFGMDKKLPAPARKANYEYKGMPAQEIKKKASEERKAISELYSLLYPSVEDLIDQSVNQPDIDGVVRKIIKSAKPSKPSKPVPSGLETATQKKSGSTTDFQSAWDSMAVTYQALQDKLTQSGLSGSKLRIAQIEAETSKSIAEWSKEAGEFGKKEGITADQAMKARALADSAIKNLNAIKSTEIKKVLSEEALKAKEAQDSIVQDAAEAQSKMRLALLKGADQRIEIIRQEASAQIAEWYKRADVFGKMEGASAEQSLEIWKTTTDAINSIVAKRDIDIKTATEEGIKEKIEITKRIEEENWQKKSEITLKSGSFGEGAGLYFEEMRRDMYSVADAGYEAAGRIREAFSSAFSDTLFNVFTGKFTNLGDVAINLGQTILRTFTDIIAKIITQKIALWAAEKMFGTAAVATSAVEAAAIGSAWAGPAAMVSLATMGANAVPAQMAITSTMAMSKLSSGLTSFAEGGVISKPTMSIIGDNPNASEAVLPLNRQGVGKVVDSFKQQGMQSESKQTVVQNHFHNPVFWDQNQFQQTIESVSRATYQADYENDGPIRKMIMGQCE